MFGKDKIIILLARYCWLFEFSSIVLLALTIIAHTLDIKILKIQFITFDKIPNEFREDETGLGDIIIVVIHSKRIWKLNKDLNI